MKGLNTAGRQGQDVHILWSDFRNGLIQFPTGDFNAVSTEIALIEFLCIFKQGGISPEGHIIHDRLNRSPDRFFEDPSALSDPLKRFLEYFFTRKNNFHLYARTLFMSAPRADSFFSMV